MKNKLRVVRFIKRYLIGFLVTILLITLSTLDPHFLRWSNILSILSQISMIGIIAVAVTFVILMDEIDLSVGSTMALSAVLCVVLTQYLSCPLAITVSLLVGIVIGTFNGLMIVFLRASSILITLAMMLIIRGVVYGLTGGNPVAAHPEQFKCLFAMGNLKLFGVPMALYLFLLFVVGGEFFLRLTLWGRSIVAIGKSQYNAIVSNIAVHKVKLIVYIVSGFIAAFVGTIYVSTLGTVDPNAGQGYEIDVIAAILLGGTQINGAKGSVSRTLFGALSLVLIANLCDVLGFDYYLQYMIKGMIILLAIIYSRVVK